MIRSTICALALVLILSFQINADHGNTTPKPAACIRTSERITIDGVLSEQVWQRSGYSEFLQQEPYQGAAPTFKSEVWFAYDDDNLYFAGKFYDPHPDSVLARLVRRDFVFGDPSDGVLLYLDPYHDHRTGYYFYVSAAGTLADGTLENDNKATDGTWDAVWEGVPHFDADGYSIEMRLPLSQIRFKDITEQVWGFDVERYFSRGGETDMIVYIPRNESGFNSRFPHLTGISGVKPSKGLELLPYITSKAEYIGNDKKDPFNGEKYTPGLGLDIKSSLGSSLTLNGTINPDFGQVEVDPAIVNLSDVEYSFSEKRPFFTEGVNIFRFGNGGTNNNYNFNWQNPTLFYSRRIGRAPQGSVGNADYAYVPNGAHIIAAGKISGQIDDNWKIGTVHAVTNRERADVSLNGEKSKKEVEPMTYYGVFRAKRDFHEGREGFGILGTYSNRFFDDASLNDIINKNALVMAVDGWTFLDESRTYVLTGWAAGSRVAGNETRMIRLQRGSMHYFQRPDASHVDVDSHATSLSGYAGRLMLNKNRGQWTINSAIGLLSPKFEINDLGYGSYSDLINFHFVSDYNWNTPTNYYKSLGVTTAFYTNYNFGGDKLLQGYFLSTYANFLDMSSAGINANYNDRSYNARRTRGGPLTVNPKSLAISGYYYTDNRIWWVLNPSISYRNGDDYKMMEYYLSVELKVTPTLTLTIGPDFTKETTYAQYYTSYADPAAANTYNRRYVFAKLDQKTLATDIRVDWILTPKLSIQAYFQPFYATAQYTDIKVLNRTKSYDFTIYGHNGSTLREGVDPSDGEYITLDADGAGPAIEAKFYKSNIPQNFNQVSLRGNVVLRWEYRPGSTLYFVWTQSRYDEQSAGDFELNRSTRRLFDAHPDNIFMVKLNYWFGL